MKTMNLLKRKQPLMQRREKSLFRKQLLQRICLKEYLIPTIIIIGIASGFSPIAYSHRLPGRAEAEGRAGVSIRSGIKYLHFIMKVLIRFVIFPAGRST